MAEIRVEGLRAGTGAVIAEFDAVLGGVTIRDCRLVRAKSGNVFCGLPSRKRRDSEEWYDVVVLSEGLRARLLEAAKEAVQRAPAEADLQAGQPADAIPF